MLRAAVVIGNTPAESLFDGFPGFVQRVQCYPEEHGDGGVAFVFSRHALPQGSTILGNNLADVNDAVRSASPVKPAHLGNANYLEYRPRL